ncbi:hypothetical protein ElyMa_005781800 [Elysia marginata]|uniref:Uncharacterized protein n=1 Tax=Elysia marginata TaxID=1093978 RepID=A0AAV4FQU6_9GAST|nr:hypothetical protein ElyMa_005781800 [Elysia marginata]
MAAQSSSQHKKRKCAGESVRKGGRGWGGVYSYVCWCLRPGRVRQGETRSATGQTISQVPGISWDNKRSDTWQETDHSVTYIYTITLHLW